MQFNWVTPTVAVLGLGLGIFNAWHSFYRRGVRLRVVPRSAWIGPGGIYSDVREHKPASTLCVEAVNLSEFPVTITEVGYTLPERNRARVIRPVLMDNKEWPRRLQPRESVTTYLEEDGVSAAIGRAYAKTDCGVTRFGNSKALKDFKRLRSSSVVGAAL
jgi:hypothetical protein